MLRCAVALWSPGGVIGLGEKGGAVQAGGPGGGGGAAEAPDLGAMLLHQKLQMVALCIARRAAPPKRRPRALPPPPLAPLLPTAAALCQPRSSRGMLASAPGECIRLRLICHFLVVSAWAVWAQWHP